MPLNIIICGGGMAGLASAAYLRQQHHVTVIEGSRAKPSTAGFGLSIFSNATSLLERLGVSATDLDAARIKHFWFRDGKTTEEYHTISLSSAFGTSPSLGIRRGVLHDVLHRLATSTDRPGKPARILFDAKVAAIDPTAAVVRTVDGREFRGDLIIGADGIGSVVRGAIQGGPTSPCLPRTNNLVGFITTIPDSVIQNIKSLDFLHETQNGGIAFFSTEDEPDNRRWVSRDRVLMYQVSPREWQVLGYTDEGEMKALFDSSRNSILKDVSRDIVMKKFEGFSDDVRGLFSHTQIAAWRIQDIEENHTWHKHNAVIIGDAAHAMLPFAGQGFNMALEDAEALSWSLRDVHVAAEVPDRLQAFVGMRLGRVALVRRHAMQIAGFPSDEEKGNLLGNEEISSIYSYKGVGL